ncbi:MAG: hypothetical protein LBL66_03695 [Clostridiales bacterium]|nr:hypothetical protein [Clostridiales bacterium]
MKTIYILSSTHWDREWYSPFEHYRARLVRMIDNLIRILENDPAYKCFHFDGQTILIEDYLRIRPENRERLYALIRAGRIQIGPWYTMPDEFLISGEGLVRNLQKGFEICRALGVEPDRNGYVCDIFGHNSQMPQIFAGFGIDAVGFFRGLSGFDKDNFLWKGADGAEAIAHKLHPDYAYSGFYYVGRHPFQHKKWDDGEFVGRIQKYLETEEKNFATDCHLMIDGVDHIDPESDVPRLIKLLNEKIKGYRFIHSNFAEYTARIREKAAGLDRIEGALYDVNDKGALNALLKNVLSSQVHLKQANDAAESGLTLNTEILDFYVQANRGKLAGYNGFAPYAPYLDLAWEYALRNQCHDSICGCSVTAVHLDNENRFKHIEELRELVDGDIYTRLSRNVSARGEGKDGALVVLNNTQMPVDGAVVVPFEIREGAHQWDFRFYGADGREVPCNIVSHRPFHKKVHDFGNLIEFPRYDRFEIAMNLKVAPYSYTTLTYTALKRERRSDIPGFTRFDAPNRNLGSMRAAANVVDNGKLVVTVNPNGSLNILDKDTGRLYENMLTMEDCGDIGEGWNYVKPAFDEEIVSTCQNARYRVISDFPDYFACKISMDMQIPARAEGNCRSAELSPCRVEHTVRILKNSKQISVTTRADNRQVNHRLRVIFPTNYQTGAFKTLLPYDLYEWPIAKKDWSRALEADTLVNPNQGVVSLNDGVHMFSVYNKGLYEVSVPDRPDRAVYLTLFRSFTNEVGSLDCDMGKMLNRKLEFEYALDFEYKSNADLVRSANAFKVGLSAFAAELGDKALPAEDTIVKIGGGAVLSALRGGRTIGKEGTFDVIRLYDADRGCTGKVSFGREIKAAYEVDLSETALLSRVKASGTAFEYALKPKQVKTYAVLFK